jgi:hypothetical protein
VQADRYRPLSPPRHSPSSQTLCNGAIAKVMSANPKIQVIAIFTAMKI